jgi:hypothetical protein
MASIEEARAAKVKVGRMLADHPDLRGVGIARANGSFGLKVNLADGRRAAAVPCDVDGVPVLVEVVGDVRALPPDSQPDGDIGAGGDAEPRQRATGGIDPAGPGDAEPRI